ncbi:hypothetical protein B9Z07_28265 [Burkholderia cenocepacia]|uniref:Uncharacterized protein n=1 Tax=Burkholderia cenocepacia TaxID=95486 RepID=A0AAD0J5G3_9BURK|nr:hypothetical protein B9Z07_28265 [Burkholderia cenocepacia]PRE33735.1 hypothetical protein C6P63_26525 [Burkholderia cenocepacia]
MLFTALLTPVELFFRLSNAFGRFVIPLLFSGATLPSFGVGSLGRRRLEGAMLAECSGYGDNLLNGDRSTGGQFGQRIACRKKIRSRHAYMMLQMIRAIAHRTDQLCAIEPVMSQPAIGHDRVDGRDRTNDRNQWRAGLDQVLVDRRKYLLAIVAHCGLKSLLQLGNRFVDGMGLCVQVFNGGNASLMGTTHINEFGSRLVCRFRCFCGLGA